MLKFAKCLQTNIEGKYPASKPLLNMVNLFLVENGTYLANQKRYYPEHAENIKTCNIQNKFYDVTGDSFNIIKQDNAQKNKKTYC